MTRRFLPTAAALAAAGALLLTACGGGDDTSKDKIAGADKAKKSASPSATAAEDDIDRPKIELPSDLTYSFTPTKTGDPDKDAVLRDNEQFIKATDLAIARSDARDKAYQFYSEGLAAAGTEKWIKEYIQYGDRTTGELRVFDRKATVSKDGTASLVYCTDESKAFNMDLKSKKVDKNPATKDSYVAYNTQLRKNDKGVWVTERMISQRGVSQCQP
ncbi:hypothetical protein [Streptomyces sp. NPDC047108]|uniref:hypothetical protein n=1 Tax=Streptomyces sp. NPDC047108 TaxID=3155025 RepID=UPI00340D3B04